MPKYIIHPLGSARAVKSLDEALQQAILECPGKHEEEGGFILVGNGQFEFIKVRNQHTGEPCAVGFYEADPREYGQKVVEKLLRGYKNYASFHTHPTGCPAYPSNIDLTRLFNGAPVNFIWSPSLGDLNQYTYIDYSYFNVPEQPVVWGKLKLELDERVELTSVE